MEQSDAIVLRVYPWSETSCVANLYTRDYGKLSVLAKGARRPKSPFEAALDLLSICRVVFIAKSADTLDILTEAKLVKRFRIGSRDLLRLNCGYYVAELLDRLTDKGDKQPEIYDLAERTFLELGELQNEPRALVLRFELQMLRMIGQLPSWQYCAQCGNDPTDGNSGDGVIFSSLSGGVLCRKCLAGARQTFRLNQRVRETLIEASQSNWTEIDVTQFPSETRSPIRKLMNRHLTSLFDRQFQLHAYLEELGR